MKWVMERDLLIAQTMAFVESVTGKKPEANLRVESPSPPSPPVIELERLETPVKIAEMPRKSPVAQSAVRAEMEGRVAAFRAHQQRFHRERDKHFNSVLTGIRAAITDPSTTSTP
jgi:hypothetical protein